MQFCNVLPAIYPLSCSLPFSPTTSKPSESLSPSAQKYLWALDILCQPCNLELSLVGPRHRSLSIYRSLFSVWILVCVACCVSLETAQPALPLDTTRQAPNA